MQSLKKIENTCHFCIHSYNCKTLSYKNTVDRTFCQNKEMDRSCCSSPSSNRLDNLYMYNIVQNEYTFQSLSVLP